MMDTNNRIQYSGDALDMDISDAEEYSVLVEFSDDLSYWEGEVSPPMRTSRRYDYSSPGTRSSRSTSMLESKSKNAIASAMATIRQMAIETDLMRKGIPGGSQPRMIKIKFGIKMDLRLGAIIAESNASTTMEVELEWARSSDDILRVLRAETDVENALKARPQQESE